MYRIEVLYSFSEEILDKIMYFLKKTYPNHWIFSEKKYYNDALNNSDNIKIIAKRNDDVVGFLLAIPHNEVALDEDMKKADPYLHCNGELYYVEQAGLLPEINRTLVGGKIFFALADEMFLEGEKRGIYKFSLHARTSNLMSISVQKRYKVIFIRRIDKWFFYGGEESVDYMEISK